MSCLDTVTNQSLTLDQTAWFDGTSPAGRIAFTVAKGDFLSIRVEMEAGRENYNVDFFNSDHSQFNQDLVLQANFGQPGTLPLWFIWVSFREAGTFYLEVARTTGTPTEPVEVEIDKSPANVQAITLASPESHEYPPELSAVYDITMNAGEVFFIFANSFEDWAGIDLIIYDEDWNPLQYGYSGFGVMAQIDFYSPGTANYHVEVSLYSGTGDVNLNLFCGVPYSGLDNVSSPFSISSTDPAYPFSLTPARLTFTRATGFNYTKHNWGTLTGTGEPLTFGYGGLTMRGSPPLARSRTLDADFVGAACDKGFWQDLYMFRGGFWGLYRADDFQTIANALVRFDQDVTQATPESEYVVAFTNNSRLGAGFTATWAWKQRVGPTPCTHTFSTLHTPAAPLKYLPIV